MNIKTPIKALLLFFVFSAGAHASTPTADLKGTIDQVVGVLANDSLDLSGKEDGIRRLVGERFDFWAMSQSVLATNWKKASRPQKEQFRDLFAKLLEKTYFTAISAYDNQTVEYGRESIKGKRATVDTFIVSDSQKIPVNYRMRLKSDGWFVYDVKVEGISLVSNYRSSFKSLFDNEGMDGVIASLEKKVGG